MAIMEDTTEVSVVQHRLTNPVLSTINTLETLSTATMDTMANRMVLNFNRHNPHISQAVVVTPCIQLPKDRLQEKELTKNVLS